VGDGLVSESENCQRREIQYSGHVQGVGFRYTVRRIAARYQVTGFVKNLPGGKVQLVAEGLPQEVGAFVSEVADTMRDYIDTTTEFISPASRQFHEFGIRF
jgi:acylphosphatase